MMRYQGLSPDDLPLSNGRRSHWRTCKEDEGIIGNNRQIDDETDDTKTIPTFIEAHKGVSKFRSSSSKTAQDENFSTDSSTVPNSLPKSNHDLNNNTTPLHNGGSGDMLLQWGHRKRSRISRSVENRSATAAGAAVGSSGMADDSSSSSSTQLQAMMKVSRRSILTSATTGLIDTKNSSNNTNIMPTPSSISITTSAAAVVVTNSSTCNGKLGNHKTSSKDNSSLVNRKKLEDRNGSSRGASSSRSKVGKRSPQNVDKKINILVNQEEEVGGFGMNHHRNNIAYSLPQPQEAAGCSNSTTKNNHEDMKIVVGATVAVAVNGGGEVHEWPRVHVPLTRKEKEEDFFLMKGIKLPHRPKKRPKAVDRMLQYCFPGTWLVDVTKARYEVKEKKCSTKKEACTKWLTILRSQVRGLSGGYGGG